MIVLISLPGFSSAVYSAAFLMRAAAETVFQQGRMEGRSIPYTLS